MAGAIASPAVVPHPEAPLPTIASVLSPRRRHARALVRRADAERDAGRYARAAVLYEEAMRLRPERADLGVQAGHMWKEAGDHAAAETHYSAVADALPDDADLQLQIGHLHKLLGRLHEAEAAYERAARLQPDLTAAQRELDALRATLGVTDFPASALPPKTIARLAPELEPRSPEAMRHAHSEGFELRRLGRPEQTGWGQGTTLRGLEAIRGFVVSAVPVSAVELRLDGETIAVEPIAGGHALRDELSRPELRKYVFNIWQDFTGAARGRHKLDLHAAGPAMDWSAPVIVADPLDETDHSSCDMVVTLDPTDPRPPEQQVRARPSMVRPGPRSLFATPPANILVLRTDQLGDLIASIPALERLRALFPAARIVGLLTGANADLARTLGLFDDLIVVDFPDDPDERRRIMPLAEQEALRRRLEPYRFDLAIDLATAGVSRPLLKLSGARWLMGVDRHSFPWLTLPVEAEARDPLTGLNVVAHGNRVTAMIEALAGLAEPRGRVIRRDDLPRAILAEVGFDPEDRYVLLHTGARIAFSRWPGYPALAARILAATDLKVVMIAEDEPARAALTPALRDDPRVLLLAERLSFDRFDALVSHAAAVVGNDSGPKHLASLRGVPVVTLFSARISWSEWGPDIGGEIVSRRLPCAGCALHHFPEECGKDHQCITAIRPDEVLDTILQLL